MKLSVHVLTTWPTSSVGDGVDKAVDGRREGGIYVAIRNSSSSHENISNR